MTRDRAETAAVLIAGPTASGKSALASDLARRIGALIVNADSMQVYTELKILTARPTLADEAATPHRLYGTVPVSRAHAVSDWLVDIAVVLDEAAADGRPLVIVGGTGLYFSALTKGLSSIPAVPDDIRAHWRAEAQRLGAAALHGLLSSRDPETAGRLGPSDTQRIVRALEVLDASGRPISAFQGAREAPVLPSRAIRARLVLAPARDELRRRIDARFRAMVEAGGLDEARRLEALGLSPALPAMKAIGVREMMAAARGELTVEAAVEGAIAATRRYAKRQETWFRNQMPEWSRVESGNFVAAGGDIAQLLQKGVDRFTGED